MKVSELIKKLNLKVLTNPEFTDRDVEGCYIGDLLSWVMGKAQAGDAWITIMNNVNVVAVASLTDCACIILCEGVTLEDAVIKKANDEDIIILSGDETAYSLAVKLGSEL